TSPHGGPADSALSIRWASGAGRTRTCCTCGAGSPSLRSPSDGLRASGTLSNIGATDGPREGFDRGPDRSAETASRLFDDVAVIQGRHEPHHLFSGDRALLDGDTSRQEPIGPGRVDRYFGLGAAVAPDPADGVVLWAAHQEGAVEGHGHLPAVAAVGSHPGAVLARSTQGRLLLRRSRRSFLRWAPWRCVRHAQPRPFLFAEQAGREKPPGDPGISLMGGWCEREDSNLHGLNRPPGPQPGAS